MEDAGNDCLSSSKDCTYNKKSGHMRRWGHWEKIIVTMWGLSVFVKLLENFIVKLMSDCAEHRSTSEYQVVNEYS